MDSNIVEWGRHPKSQVILEQEGECDIITHYNTLTPAPDPDVYSAPIGDHVFRVDFGDGVIPDTFSITPAYGWEVVSDNFIVVAEGASAVIKVCQVLLG